MGNKIIAGNLETRIVELCIKLLFVTCNIAESEREAGVKLAWLLRDARRSRCGRLPSVSSAEALLKSSAAKALLDLPFSYTQGKVSLSTNKQCTVQKKLRGRPK